jgi:hypothetical protein
VIGRIASTSPPAPVSGASFGLVGSHFFAAAFAAVLVVVGAAVGSAVITRQTPNMALTSANWMGGEI